MSGVWDYTALPGNPFVVNGQRLKGKPWILPPLDANITLPQGAGPGYGCFSNPTQPVGNPLDITWNNTKAVTIENACGPGMFCPYLNINDPATWPVVCQPDYYCFGVRAFGRNCMYPQGVFEPMICPPGFYCPDYKTVIPCPEGSYCLSGQTAPTTCEFLSACKIGTVIQAHYGLLIIVVIIDVILLGGFAFLKYREAKLANPASPPKKEANPAPPPSPAPSDLTATTIPEKLVSSANHSQSENISALTASVHKSLNGQDNLQMTYDFEGLSLKLPDGKMILQGVTGAVKAGRMTAIMGPSGAGKTTFMNVLMGKVARTAGTLKINGTVAEMASFKKIIGYVPQEDTMIEELTVRENIRYSARTRLPNSWTNAEVENHVDAILKALNLAHVAHKRIGNVLERGISGGQRKRVNIGLELAAAPLTVFLDEPTSGLDSTGALDAVNILHSISRLGLTIVAVIHQPRVEIFEAFDDVLMIAPGGRTSYFGPVAGAKPYFEDLGFEFKPTANDADTLMDILAGRGEIRSGYATEIKSPDRIVDQWTSYMKKQTVEVPETNSAAYVGGTTQLDEIAKARGASFIRQVGLSHNRSIAQQIRLISGFVMELLVGMLCGGIMGFACNGGESVYGMMNYPYTALSPGPNYWFLAMYGMLIGISISLAAATSGVKVFSEEKAIYIREVAAGHNGLAYFLGKNLSVIYRIALASAHFVALYYFLAQPPISLGLQYVLIFLNFFGIYGLGMIISMIVRRENAPILAVTTALITEVLCGFGPTLKQAVNEKFDFIMDIGVNRWMCEAQFALWLQPYQNVYSFEEATNQFGYKFGNTNRNIGAMIGIGLAYRAIAGILFVMVLNSGAINQFWQQVKTGAWRKKLGAKKGEDKFLVA